MIILGVDSGMASCGYGVVRVSRGRVSVLDVGVIRTPANTDIDQRTDRARRIALVGVGLRELRTFHGVDMIAGEQAQSHGNVNAVIPQALCWGSLTAIATEADIDCAEVTPKEWQHEVQPESNGKAIDYDALVSVVTPHIGEWLARIDPKQRTHAIDGYCISLYAALRPVTLVWRGRARRERNVSRGTEATA